MTPQKRQDTIQKIYNKKYTGNPYIDQYYMIYSNKQIISSINQLGGATFFDKISDFFNPDDNEDSEQTVSEEQPPVVEEQSVTEQSVTEQSVPEQSVPEQSVPEQSVPEQSVPEQSPVVEDKFVKRSELNKVKKQLKDCKIENDFLNKALKNIEDSLKF